MKAILLCNDTPNQAGLARALQAVHPLAHIAIIDLAHTKRAALSHRIAGRTIGWPLSRAWFAMLAHFDAAFPPVPTSRHLGVNSAGVRELMEREQPDLVMVSGTDLLRQPLIDAIAPHGRILNLHTGLSPYIKGGPNCTNWALALGDFHLIGNTVMWIDAGIDSGNLVITEQTPITGRESLTALHIAVMEHAHQLYARAYRALTDGTPVANVPQSAIGKGRLFLTKHWTPAQMARAVGNFVLRYRPGRVHGEAVTVPRDIGTAPAEAS